MRAAAAAALTQILMSLGYPVARTLLGQGPEISMLMEEFCAGLIPGIWPMVSGGTPTPPPSRRIGPRLLPPLLGRRSLCCSLGAFNVQRFDAARQCCARAVHRCGAWC